MMPVVAKLRAARYCYDLWRTCELYVSVCACVCAARGGPTQSVKKADGSQFMDPPTRGGEGDGHLGARATPMAKSDSDSDSDDRKKRRKEKRKERKRDDSDSDERDRRRDKGRNRDRDKGDRSRRDRDKNDRDRRRSPSPQRSRRDRGEHGAREPEPEMDKHGRVRSPIMLSGTYQRKGRDRSRDRSRDRGRSRERDRSRDKDKDKDKDKDEPEKPAKKKSGWDVPTEDVQTGATVGMPIQAPQMLNETRQVRREMSRDRQCAARLPA